MTIYDPFDVVIVPFPFTDNAKQKPRPALVMSSRGFNAGHDHVILLMITTAIRTQWPSDIAIADLRAAGLTAASVVRFKCFTLEEAIVTRKIGALSARDRAAALAGVRQVLVQ